MSTVLSQRPAAATRTQPRSTTKATQDRRPAAKCEPAAEKTSAPAIEPAAQITHEAIARRAREIWLSGRGSTDLANWLQAEKELRAKR